MSNLPDSSWPLSSLETDLVVTQFVKEAPGRIRASLAGTVQISNTRIDWTSGHQELLNLLSDGNYKIILDRNVRSLADGHGSWILCTTQLTEWLSAAQSQLLWLHDDPVVGKATAKTVLIQEVFSPQKIRVRLGIKDGEASLQFTSNIVAHFFCQRSKSISNLQPSS